MTRTVSEALKQAILAASVSRYQISQGTGIEQSTLSRFVRGERSLDLTTVDKLAAYLDLELKQVGRRQKRGRTVRLRKGR